MKTALRLIFQMFLFTSLLSGTWTVAGAQDTSQRPTPDNAKVNKRDKNSSEPTADQQKDNRSDRDITQQIRQAVVNDKSLSTDAHNVKIISQNGMVTLKGPVGSEDEKHAVEAKAAGVVGPDKVTNELDVEPKK